MNNRDVKEDWNIVIELLKTVKSKISDETDLLWTNYNSAEELIAEINQIHDLLIDNNKAGLNRLSYLFAPTGTLQEISMQNDWIQEYLNLSSKFDTLYEILK